MLVATSQQLKRGKLFLEENYFWNKEIDNRCRKQLVLGKRTIIVKDKLFIMIWGRDIGNMNSDFNNEM